MPAIRQVSGSEWPTSGAASAGTTGISAVSGLTHVGSSDVPLGSGATGYLTAVKNTVSSITIDGSGTYWQGGEKNVWMKCWMRGVRDRADAIAANDSYSGGSASNGFIVVSAGGTKYRVSFRQRNFSLGGSQTICEAMSITSSGNVNTAYVEPKYGYIPFIEAGDTGGWVEVLVHLYSDGSSSYGEFYVNGVLVDTQTLCDFTSVTATNFALTFHPFLGITWQVCAPIESWQGTDLAVNPVVGLDDDSEFVTRAFLVNGVNLAKGGFWTSTGTATVAASSYGTSGSRPYRKRMIASGSSGQSAEIVSTVEVGDLPFDANGTASIAFPMVYVPGGGTVSFNVRNAADDRDLIKIDYDGTALKQGANTLATLSNTSRYSLFLHLGTDGSATWTIQNLSLTSPSNQDYVTSGVCPDGWTVGTVGKVRYAVVLGSASVEIDGIYVAKCLDFLCTDSYVHSIANGVTPDMACGSSHAGYLLSEMSAGTAVPAGPKILHWLDYPRTFVHVIGRSGHTLQQLWEDAVSNMTHTRGYRLVMINGAGPNGIHGVVTDAASKATFLATAESVIRNINSVVIAGNGKIWWSTQARNELNSTEYPEAAVQAINEVSALIIRLASEMQSGSAISVSDVAAEVGRHSVFWSSGFDAAGTHMQPTGDDLFLATMVGSMEVAERSFGGPVQGSMRLGI